MKRRALRELLKQFAVPSYSRALFLVALDLTFFVLGSVAVVQLPGVLPKFAASALLGFVISRMFVLGHDAGHQSLTPSRRLNDLVGRLLFLPSYTAYSLWNAGHNVVHHGFAGLRGRDIPWVPLSPQAYLGMTRSQQLLYRAYRAWWGAGLYYGHAIWWQQMMFPKGKNRPQFIFDCWLVTAFFIVQCAVYVASAYLTGQSPWLLLIAGVATPFVIWLYMAAIVFYLHHTDETTRWYDDANEWKAAQPNLEDTHGTRLPLRLDMLLHHALEHTAHHVNASIPSYRLSSAQRMLEQTFGAEVQTRPITLRRYLEITAHCQLYDSRLHRWVRFSEVAALALLPSRGTVQAEP